MMLSLIRLRKRVEEKFRAAFHLRFAHSSAAS